MISKGAGIIAFHSPLDIFSEAYLQKVVVS
nr:MAG TPA: hypothetical protein [Bacteriophage sp.]